MNARRAFLVAIGALSTMSGPFIFGPAQAIEVVKRPKSAADSLEYAGTILLPRDPAGAASMSRSALQSLGQQVRPDSIAILHGLDVLVQALIASDKGAEAETRSLAETTVWARDRLQGEAGQAEFPSLHQLAKTYESGHRYRDAKKTLERALKIRSARLGKHDPRTAESMSLLANLLVAQTHAGAVNHTTEKVLGLLVAIAIPIIAESIHEGAGDKVVDQELSGGEEVLTASRDLGRAESLAREALRIRVEALPAGDPAIASSHVDVALVDRDRGALSDASFHLDQAHEIYSALHGPQSVEAERCDLAMADLGLEQMDYRSARTAFAGVIKSLESAAVPDSILLARACIGMGAAFEGLEDSTRSRVAFEKARAYLGRRVGPLGLLPVDVDLGVARLLTRGHDYAGAGDQLTHALGLAQSIGGPNHTLVATVHMEMGCLARERGDLKAASKQFDLAQDIRKRAFGDLHPLVAACLLESALIKEARDQESDARDDWDKALRILDQTLGPSHPTTALARQRAAVLYRRNLVDFASVKVDTGYTTQDVRAVAFEMGMAGHQAWRRYVTDAIQFLPEPEAMLVASRPSLGLDVAMGLLQPTKAFSRGHNDVESVWDELIRGRGLVLDEMAERNRQLAGEQDSTVAALQRNLIDRRQRLATLLVRGAGSESFRRYASGIVVAREEVSAAEQALYERSARFRRRQDRGDVGLKQVLAAIPPGAALVAYARYHQMDKKHDEDHYLAFYCINGKKPRAVRLERAQRIEDAVTTWRQTVGQGAFDTAKGDGKAEASFRAAGEYLRGLIWDPVIKDLGSCQRVYVVPDGSLSLINWTALPVGPNGYLIEKGPLIHYLSTERDLVQEADTRTGLGGVLLLGGPDFDSAPAEEVAGAQLAAAGQGRESPDATQYRGLHASCVDFDRVRFRPLPGTLEEVRRIAQRVRVAQRAGGATDSSVVLLLGDRASESGFRARARGMNTIHLATHGFVLSGECPSAADESRAIGAVAFDETPVVAAPTGDVPLRLSGLALAGANRRATAPTGADDGILTSEEIATLDLSSVQWAVLSACDTGVGDPRAGEGVFGVRRAFQLAGARTLIMSLWSIDDQATCAWMDRLYELRLAGKMDTAECVREASLSVLRDRRAKGESTHPFYWGGFVAVGDWR